MLEEVVVRCWEVRRIWQMRQNFIAQFVQLLKRWLCSMRSGTVVEENRALSADQCWLQVFQFVVHLTDLLRILLRCNAFAGIQRAGVDQMGSSPPNSGHDIFWGSNLALGSSLKLLLGPTTELVIAIVVYNLFVSCHSPIEKWFVVVA